MSSTRISVRLDRSLRAKIRKQARAAGKKEAEVIREDRYSVIIAP